MVALMIPKADGKGGGYGQRLRPVLYGMTKEAGAAGLSPRVSRSGPTRLRNSVIKDMKHFRAVAVAPASRRPTNRFWRSRAPGDVHFTEVLAAEANVSLSSTASAVV